MLRDDAEAAGPGEGRKAAIGAGVPDWGAGPGLFKGEAAVVAPGLPTEAGPAGDGDAAPGGELVSCVQRRLS